MLYVGSSESSIYGGGESPSRAADRRENATDGHETESCRLSCVARGRVTPKKSSTGSESVCDRGTGVCVGAAAERADGGRMGSTTGVCVPVTVCASRSISVEACCHWPTTVHAMVFMLSECGGGGG